MILSATARGQADILNLWNNQLLPSFLCFKLVSLGTAKATTKFENCLCANRCVNLLFPRKPFLFHKKNLDCKQVENDSQRQYQKSTSGKEWPHFAPFLFLKLDSLRAKNESRFPWSFLAMHHVCGCLMICQIRHKRASVGLYNCYHDMFIIILILIYQPPSL